MCQVVACKGAEGGGTVPVGSNNGDLLVTGLPGLMMSLYTCELTLLLHIRRLRMHATLLPLQPLLLSLSDTMPHSL